MTYKFPSDEWIKCMGEEINKSEAYRKSALNWEGDFYLIVEPGPGLDEPMILYLDLWHGECREAGEIVGSDGKNPEFTIRAPVTTWRRVIEKKLDPIQGMVAGRLKLKGTMSKIMRYPKAASELVNCATKVPSEFQF